MPGPVSMSNLCDFKSTFFFIEIDVQDLCANNNPCQNGGKCRLSGATHFCFCPPGDWGPNCEQCKRLRHLLDLSGNIQKFNILGISCFIIYILITINK